LGANRRFSGGSGMNCCHAVSTLIYVHEMHTHSVVSSIIFEFS
jgi:hypothetical protein